MVKSRDFLQLQELIHPAFRLKNHNIKIMNEIIKALFLYKLVESMPITNENLF